MAHSSSRPVPALPFDVLETILTHLRPQKPLVQPIGYRKDTKRDLCQCALVSRIWRGLAQRHLFHDTTYSFSSNRAESLLPEGTHSLSRWHDAIYEEVPLKTFELLQAFLIDPVHSHILPFIQCLRLVRYPTIYVTQELTGNDLFQYVYSREGDIEPYDLCRTISLMPALRDLQLHNIIFHGIGADHHYIADGFNSIALDRLVLALPRRSVSEDSALECTSILDLLSPFSSLRTVEIRFCTCSNDTPTSMDWMIKVYPTVRSLTLDHVAPFSSLLPQLCFSSLQSLDVGCALGTNTNRMAMSKYLELIGPNLLHLAYSLDDDTKFIHNIHNLEDVSYTIDLSSCRNLRSLTIRVNVYAHSELTISAWDSARLSVQSLLPALKLQEVIICTNICSVTMKWAHAAKKSLVHFQTALLKRLISQDFDQTVSPLTLSLTGCRSNGVVIMEPRGKSSAVPGFWPWSASWDGERWDLKDAEMLTELFSELNDKGTLNIIGVAK